MDYFVTKLDGKASCLLYNDTIVVLKNNNNNKNMMYVNITKLSIHYNISNLQDSNGQKN